MKWSAFATAIALAVVPVASAIADARAIEAMKAGYTRPASIPFPANNPYTDRKAELGKMLFFDPRLSGANNLSCASCHNPSLSWSDGLPRGIGNEMTVLPRRTPTILNLAWANLLIWDGREADLETQMAAPVSGPTEMNQNLDRLVAVLAAIPGYRREFELVFPGRGIGLRQIAQAVATYERTVVSGIAPFDRWIAGDDAAISPAAQRGFVLFNTKARCAACHSGWNFTDNGFHDIGLPEADRGRAAVLDLPIMEHAFKTPTLRDVSRRGPYLHDGSLATLMAVVDHYDGGGIERPSLSPEIKPLHLDPQQKSDLVDFMLTLSGENAPVQLPVLFPGTQAAER